MSLPANDTLISGSTQNLGVYSANWTETGSQHYEVSTSGGFPGNVGGGGADVGGIWNADAFPNDQYAQIVLNGGLTGTYNGVCVRGDSSGNNAYYIRVNQADSIWQVRKIVGGSASNLSGNQSGTFVTGDVIKITIVGTTLTAYQNSTVLYTTSDSSLASGSAGVYAFGSGTAGGFAKNWQGGATATSQPSGGMCM